MKNSGKKRTPQNTVHARRQTPLENTVFSISAETEFFLKKRIKTYTQYTPAVLYGYDCPQAFFTMDFLILFLRAY